jgi:rare lipoprotein A (peptidoglycan hydrolase)
MLLITRTNSWKANSERGGFDKNKYTAAHKITFGTELKSLMKPTEVYNCQITDRGTFVKSREIDLSKAFMDIVNNKGAGSMLVTIEVLVK